jgi:hypothetical protein
MLTWIKLGVAVFAVGALLLLGFKVSEWREGYLRAEKLQVDLTAAQDRADMEEAERKRIDRLRAEADAKLLDAQEQARINADARREKVKQVVADNRTCDLGPDAVGLLNSAIRDDPVPGTPGNVEESRSATSSDHWRIPTTALAP